MHEPSECGIPKTTRLSGGRFRASPLYELVLFDHLTGSEQQIFESLRGGREFYGVLRPRREGLTAKSVSRDTALLLLTLQTVSSLPRYVIDELAEKCDDVIAQMVLDGVLEMERDGAMLSGPEALSAITGGVTISSQTMSPLSRHALQYAERLQVGDAGELALRLYAYNRIPASFRWLHLWPNENAVQLHLGLTNPSFERTLNRSWSRLPCPPRAAWMAWQSRRVQPQTSCEATYKLYISPNPAALSAMLASTIRVLCRSRAFQWKLGRNAYGLLRPDKLVVYFRRFIDLQEAAAELAEGMARCPPHGVPFTVGISEGLLSWGIDPPPERDSVAWLMRESWRSRICNRLASAILQAKTAGVRGISPAGFAIERLRLDGIDPTTWTPAQ